MLEIRRIHKEDYPNGKKIIYEYISDRYYDVSYTENENAWTIDFILKYFETPFHKYWEGEIFENYLENIDCYIAELNGKEVGIVSITHEKWNNVLRINEIHVHQSEQNKGIASKLMTFIINQAKEIGVRAIVLETQTSNFPAIQFYKKHGFHLIGYNLLSYTNDDMKNKEVRLEMGLVFN